VNTRLKAARLAAGYHSQQALADALKVGVRQVRRWESEAPPWPQPEVAQALTRLLGQELEALGFTPPGGLPAGPARRTVLAAAGGLAAVPTQAVAVQPATAADDYAAVTRSHRRLYWSVAPATLHPAALAHATFGCALLPETVGQTRQRVAAALAETWLLAGRIEFFDMRDADRAQQTLLRALQAAGEADDSLIGAAVLAHTAFIPGWAGDREGAVERMVAARTYARRGPASVELLAWLDAVEAECETRCGNTRTALHLIGTRRISLTRAASTGAPSGWTGSHRSGWPPSRATRSCVPVTLPQARATLLGVLDALDAGRGEAGDCDPR
jgi:transcriptional regulator with XRE-family HTH domain